MKKIALSLVLLCAVLYTSWWFVIAETVKSQIKNNSDIFITHIGGFPGPMVIEGRASTTTLWQGEVQKVIIPEFSLRGFPLHFLDTTLTLPKGLSVEGSLDPEIWSLDQLELTGPLPLDFPQVRDEPTMKAWRDGGGRLTLNHFSFAKGTLRGEGAGTLNLDNTLQPAGMVNARISGHIEYLNFLVGKGMIKKNDAMLASTILGGLSSPDEDTGINHMDIGIRLQNQSLYAGPLAVAQLPLLRWGNDSLPVSPQSPDAGLPASVQTYPEASGLPRGELPVATPSDPQ